MLMTRGKNQPNPTTTHSHQLHQRQTCLETQWLPTTDLSDFTWQWQSRVELQGKISVDGATTDEVDHPRPINMIHGNPRFTGMN